jgi:signal transduction histidine kinase
MRTRREWVTDGLIGVALAAPVVSNQVTRGSVAGCLGALTATVGAVVVARRWPLLGWLIVVLGTLVDGNFVFAIPVLSYLAGLRTGRIWPVAAAFAGLAAAGTVLNLAVLGTGPAEWFELVLALLVLGIFPWLAGRYQAQRRRLVTAGWERAARLESERRMVVLRERSRIAREMHDSLGHELSLIALGAGALETSPVLPAEQRAAATRIRESAATATDQLREIIGVLRDEGEAAPLEPVDERVEALVDRAAKAGVPVTMTPTPDAPAPATVERTAYHVVRESLTNASRHAPGAPVVVDVVHEQHSTIVTVTNPATRAPDARPGFGLVGLRERVRLSGGTLTAGPQDDGVFRLRAEIPHQPAPKPPEAATEMVQATRRVRRSLAAAVLTPAALALVAAFAYYPFAANGSVLAEDAFERMTIGTPRAELALPERQVWRRTTDGLSPAPAGATCELYSDGNFPLADAEYRLCFAGGRLVRKERLR